MIPRLRPKEKPLPFCRAWGYNYTMRIWEHTIEEGEAGLRVEQLLRRKLRMAPGQIRSLTWREGALRRNGGIVRAADALCAGDMLTVRLDDPGEQNNAEPMNAPLAIVYEDNDLLLINKSPDMAVHGAREGPCTLANALAFHRPELPFHPVHRLDRGTSGLILLAKHAHAQDRLRCALHTVDFQREYLALCEHAPGTGSVALPLGYEGKKRIVDAKGQRARTDYETVETFADCALVRLQLHTGRTHQIRAHMAAIGCPLLGDALYGGAALLQRPALHSWRVSFTQPLSGERLRFTAALPEDMATFTERRNAHV